VTNIIAINRDRLTAQTEIGEVLPIVRLFDAYGDEVLFWWENPMTFVAGPSREGLFYVDRFDSFESGGKLH